jgi:hypothetical protein
MQVFTDPLAQHSLTNAQKAMFETGLAPSYVHARDFIEGGLHMLFEEEQMADMMICTKMLDRTQAALDLAYYEIVDGADMRTMLKGGYRAFLGIGDIFGTAACFWEALDLGAFAVFFDQLTSISDKDFIELLNLVMQSYQDATDLWAQGYYYHAGENFAKSLVELTGGPVEGQVAFNDPVIEAMMRSDEMEKAIEEQEKYQLSQKVAGIVDGFLYAMTGEQSQDNLASCVSDQKRIAADVDEAFMLIKTRHVENVVAGVNRLADLIGRMPRYLSSCPSRATHSTDFKAWLKAYSQAAVQTNFLKLDKQMNVEFAKAQFDYTNELYWEFGEELGAILMLFTQ